MTTWNSQILKKIYIYRYKSAAQPSRNIRLIDYKIHIITIVKYIYIGLYNLTWL